MKSALGGGKHFYSAAELADGLEAGEVGVWHWNVLSGKLTWSHNLEAIHGLPSGAFDGTFEAFVADIHPEDRQRVMEEIRGALESSDTYRVQYRLPQNLAGQIRWLEARGRVRRDSAGKPVAMTGICEDITVHKQAETELGLRARQVEALVELGEHALTGADLEQVFEETVKLTADLLTADFAEILELSQDRETLTVRAAYGWHSDVIGRVKTTSGPETQIGHALRSSAPVVFSDIRAETRFSLSELAAEEGVLSGASIALGGNDGMPFGVLAAYCHRVRCVSPTDVRFLQSVANLLGHAIRAKRDHERKELLIGELRHRVGNLFSLVQALHRQTGQSATDARDLEMKFGARLAALASAHTLILESGWQRTSLRGLLETTLAPYLERVDFAGGDVQVPAESAFSFSMALHEMATNANKYGALSNPEGRLRVDIRSVADPLGRRLVLDWKECDGPPPTDSHKEGFGSRLISQVVERQLGGQVTRTVEPNGLRFTIEFPIA
jgi:PAS domain S-box-containing protein